MIHTGLRTNLLFAPLVFGSILAAQTTPSSTPPGGPSAGASSGTYSIEAEIFAYNALQKNSETIASDVVPQLKGASGVVIVPSTSAVVPAFQLWRANILVIQNFLAQSQSLKDCPVPTTVRDAQQPSFAAYASGVTEAVGAIQSIVSLFASSQSVLGLPGTIQDQALITAVARQLRTGTRQVLVPDIFVPWTIDTVNGMPSPFISKVSTLVTDLMRLQDVYQCNQLAVNAGSQLQQAEASREGDFSKLLDPTLTGANRNAVITDIGNLTAQIAVLRLKLGIPAENNAVVAAERAIAQLIGTFIPPAPANSLEATQQSNALSTIRSSDASVISTVENPIMTAATLTAAKAQSLVAGAGLSRRLDRRSLLDLRPRGRRSRRARCTRRGGRFCSCPCYACAYPRGVACRGTCHGVSADF